MKQPPIYKALYSQVLFAIILGVLFGYLWPAAGTSLKPLADGFINLVKMMVAPVVFCTIVLGIAGMRDAREIGRTIVKALALFYVLTAIALATGLAAVFVFKPGTGM